MRPPTLIQRLRSAFEEDSVSSDLTTLAIPNIKRVYLTGHLIAKQSGVLSGVTLIPNNPFATRTPPLS